MITFIMSGQKDGIMLNKAIAEQDQGRVLASVRPAPALGSSLPRNNNIVIWLNMGGHACNLVWGRGVGH